MKRYHKLTPEGTHDLLFEDCQAVRLVERTLGEAFSSRGFNEVVTPGLEFYDVFDPECSGISPESMYKTGDRHGRIVVLRPDSTMPIARLTATRLQGLPKPLRLYYTQAVYRSNPGLTGRSDEVLQTGIELLGAAGRRADLEVLVTAVEALSRCVPSFRLELGHAGFFGAIAKKLPIAEGLREDIRRGIESKNYAALNSILEGLGDCKGVEAMRRLPRLFGGEEVFAQAEPYCDESTAPMLEYLHEIYCALAGAGLGERVIVDLGLVQRNDYYTGLVFSAYAENCGDAILCGGRYDNLLARFDDPMPAIGFSVNVDAVAKLMAEQRLVPPPKAPDVLVHGDGGYELAALALATKLVEGGALCESSVFETREEARAYAAQRGIIRVEFVGENEAREGAEL